MPQFVWSGAVTKSRSCSTARRDSTRRGRQSPKLVLLDMSLPVKVGWIATAELKADPATRPIRVIGLSAHAMAGDRDRAMEFGCDDYDTKLIEIDRLLGKIEALLGRTTK